MVSLEFVQGFPLPGFGVSLVRRLCASALGLPLHTPCYCMQLETAKFWLTFVLMSISWVQGFSCRGWGVPFSGALPVYWVRRIVAFPAVTSGGFSPRSCGLSSIAGASQPGSARRLRALAAGGGGRPFSCLALPDG